MTSKQGERNELFKKIKKLLSKTPGLSVKEIAKASEVNRQFMAGFLLAMEEKGDVYSRKVGPARIYFNNEVKTK
jgi:predicted transcriptional regulator